MPVFAWFIFTDSFSTFFLPVVLDLAVVAIFPIAIGVVSGSGSIYAAAVLSGCVGYLSFLEGGNITFILPVEFVFLLDCCDRLRGMGGHPIVALRCPGVLPLCSVLELVVPSVLESCDYVLFILGL
jgi:hypothetical protein